MALSGFAAMSIFSGKVAEKERKAYEEAGKIATEATLNIRWLGLTLIWRKLQYSRIPQIVRRQIVRFC